MPRAALTAPPATYQDIIDAPKHMVAEILNGELHLSPRPAPSHARAITNVAADVAPLFGRGRGGPGGWLILVEPELWLGTADPRDTVCVPDLAGWKLERQPGLPDTNGFTTPPDWACEVVSPSSGQRDRVLKVAIYAKAGIPHLWLIDPLQQSLEVLRLDGSTYRLVGAYAGDDIVRAEPFDAVELELSWWWGLAEPGRKSTAGLA